MTSKLDHALALAAEGFHVFPCIADSKKPAVKFKEWATRDPAKIAEYWQQRPDSNIGIYTGRFGDSEALLVVDIDVKEGKDGNDALLELELEGHNLGETRIHRTATGGQHLLYRVAQPVRQGAGVLGKGVDLRSRGGYVVGPGSSIGDGHYDFVSGVVERCPDWLLHRVGDGRPEREPDGGVRGLAGIHADTARESARRYLDSAPVAIEGAAGDQTTYKVACRVKDCGVTEADAIALMAEHWNDRCSPPWSIDDLSTKVVNAYRYGLDPPGAALPQAAFERVNPDYKGLAFKLFHDIRPDLTKPALVQNWLDREAFSVLYGPPGSAKSFNALHLAFCVATGQAWFGNKVEQGGVVYLALEGGAGVERRVEALRRHHGVTGRIPLAISRGPVDLSVEGQGTMQPLYDMIVEAGAVMGVPVALLIVDTVARANPGGDENSSKDMGVLVNKLDRLRLQFGFHVLAIHHSGKDVDRGLRGSSALHGAIDTAILISDGVISVPDGEAGKQRDRGRDGKIGFKLTEVVVGEDASGDLVTSAVVESAPIVSRVKVKPLTPKTQVMFQALHDAGGKSYDAWMRQARFQKLLSVQPDSARGQMNTAVRELTAAGKIRVEGDVVTVLE